MIDAVTYGMIPSAKIENRDSANRRRGSAGRAQPAATAVEEALDLGGVDVLGAGIHDPMRYSARIPAVNRSRRRSSGTRHALASQDSKA